jgi:outer membrane protein assembly factor BamE (lipoprotein component of BamABCDE complex)
MPESDAAVKPLRAAVILGLLAIGLPGCVVPESRAPGRGQVPPQAVQALKVGASTRAEILMQLGAPDRRLLDDRVFGYLWSEALVTLIFPAGYQAGGFTVWGKRMLLIEFAADGIVVRTGTVDAATARGIDEAVKAWVAQAKDTTP